MAMGDGATYHEAPFEHIKDMSPFVFPLFDHLGGVRVTAEDAVTLLPGTYIDDVIVNFYAHYFRGTAIQPEKMEGVLVLPTYVFKLILYNGRRGRSWPAASWTYSATTLGSFLCATRITGTRRCCRRCTTFAPCCRLRTVSAERPA